MVYYSVFKSVTLSVELQYKVYIFKGYVLQWLT